MEWSADSGSIRARVKRGPGLVGSHEMEGASNRDKAGVGTG